MERNFANDLDRVLEFYTEILVGQRRSPEIISAYCADVRRFLLWCRERGNPIYGRPHVSRTDVITYLDGLKPYFHPEERNRILAALRAYYAFREGCFDPRESPTWGIPNFWDDVKAYSWLDAEQQRLLESTIDEQLQALPEMAYGRANGTRAAALVRFLLHTGVHAMEAQRVRLEDVRFGDTLGMLHVSGKQERNLQLDEKACAALRSWLSIRPEVGQDWLWIEVYQGNPHPMHVRGILHACWRLSRLSGLGPKTVTPRVLRNTCAHNLLAAGLAPQHVRRLLRMKDLDYVLCFK